LELTKTGIQTWVDRQYDEWIERYSPQKFEGDDVLERHRDVDGQLIWTISSDFIQDFFTAADGRELAFRAICIVPGIHDYSDGDVIFVSPRSWSKEGDEFTEIRLEVVTPCQTCKGAGSDCSECDATGEWTTVASGWVV